MYTICLTLRISAVCVHVFGMVLRTIAYCHLQHYMICVCNGEVLLFRNQYFETRLVYIALLRG